MNILIYCLSVTWTFAVALGMSIEETKFLYHQDVSEHCRRKVLPSVFLGHHVLRANSKMMHFSRLELPYNCYISIRTESGNHIILVVQVQSELGLAEACRKNGDQLLVYQTSETFGGYWGYMLKDGARPTLHTPTTYYTMPAPSDTAPPAVATLNTNGTKHDNDNYDENVSFEDANITTTDKVTRDEQPDTIVVEIPILNVSGQLEPADTPLELARHADDKFDKYYDVMPRTDVAYNRELVPIVKFSTMEDDGQRRKEDGPRFEISYDEDLFGTRSPYHTVRRFGSFTSYTPNRFTNLFSRRTMFTLPKYGKNSVTFSEEKPTARMDKNWSDVVNLINNINNSNILNKVVEDSTLDSKYVPRDFTKESIMWDGRRTVYNILDKARLSRLKDFTSFTKHRGIHRTTEMPFQNYLRKFKLNDKKQKTTTHIDVKNTKADHSEPINMWDKPISIITNGAGNISSFNNTFSLIERATTTTKYKSETPGTYTQIVDFDNKESISNDLNQYGTVPYDGPSSLEMKENSLRSSNQNRITKIIKWNSVQHKITVNSTKLLTEVNENLTLRTTGHFVNHESWENLVQVAPEMEVLLNKTLLNFEENNITKKNDNVSMQNAGYPTVNQRKKIKRYIEPISIKKQKPHNILKSPSNVTFTEIMDSSDIVDQIANLVDLTDDDIVMGRVSRRRLWRYVGQRTLFNVCDHLEPNKRHVLLLKTSRVILLITNFTLKGMTIVTTSAHTLHKSDAKCSVAQLECQVSGHRVCIESSCACDGVPNCGSYDIYDEDRLRCGSTEFQYNIYLAVVAFLAVVLTTIYTIYFWLRRCVPQVSDAFFVYISGTDNVLFLDSIMRSPHDTDDFGKAPLHLNYFEDNTYLKKKKYNSIYKILYRCCIRLITCTKDSDEGDTHEDLESRRKYSFAEYEISRMASSKTTADAGVQTGESLEMTHFTTVPIESAKDKPKSAKDFGVNESLFYRNKYQEHGDLDELNTLKIMKQSRSSSSVSDNRTVDFTDSLIINQHYSDENDTPAVNLHDDREKSSDYNTLQYGGGLGLGSILSLSQDDPKHGSIDYPKKRLRFEKRSNHDLENISEERFDDNQKASSSKDFQLLRFWNREPNKNKKQKKPHQSFSTPR